MRWMGFGLILVFWAMSAFSADDADTLARRARRVFTRHCAECHHGEGSQYREFDVREHATLVKDGADGKAVVVAKNLKGSLLWKEMGEHQSMPPREKDRRRPSSEELEIVQQWIESGAPAFPSAKREFISLETQLAAIRDDLAAADKSVRPFLCYFTLTHLHNNAKIEEEELRGERAALSLAINSLSWRPLVQLRAVDKFNTIYAVNIKDLDWEKLITVNGRRVRIIERIQQEYPFGVDYTQNSNPKVKALAEQIAGYSRDLPILRSDWTISNATRPPLYFEILDLPKTVGELEAQLGVHSEADFLADKLLRAGSATSAVSAQNRAVDRYDSQKGVYYYRSWDFKPKKGRSNLLRFALGPNFAGNPFNDQAFLQDGGEMIFGLPNGLQGYFLSDGKGNRIDEGPTDVVSDSKKTSGTPAIVNGLSCMYCHQHGTLAYTDTIRDGHALLGDAKEKVEHLYRPKEFAAKIDDDGNRFVAALEHAIGPFMQINEDKTIAIRDFDSPIGDSARRYLLSDLSLEMAAFELGLEKPSDFATVIKNNKRLQSLGLMPLANGKLIKRGDWEAVDGYSLFQDVSNELKLGSPIHFSK